MLRTRWTQRMVVPGAVAALIGALAVVAPAAPAAAATAITVTPSTNLVQGQTISVSGTGYPVNAIVGIIQCAAGAQTVSDCELRYTTTSTDPSGSFTNGSFTVHQVINTGV